MIRGNGEITSTEGTTQGDPLAMAMFALAVSPLIQKLHINCPSTKQVWYADDATGAGSCRDLRVWWDCIQSEGPKYGYFPNSLKTHLIVKPDFESTAKSIFKGTAVNITSNGHRHLGAVIGSKQFRDDFVSNKVMQWCEEVELLAGIALSHPHAAYAAFIKGLTSRWLF